MSTEGIGSVTRWISEYLARGDEEAARQLSNRYFEKLVGLARAKLEQMGQSGGPPRCRGRGEQRPGEVLRSGPRG